MKKALQSILTILCSSIMLMSTSSTAIAMDAIPKETGVSGFINLGVMGMSVETNMLSKTPLNDLGKENINSLTDTPDSKSSAIPLVNFELSYTWAESRTQIFIGNRLEDFLRFDFATNLGVRQGAGRAGVFGLAAISTPLKTKVWRDPYQINVKREDTDRTSEGFRISWDKILGSQLEIRASTRDVEIDDELSGTAEGLSAAERALLNREGKTKSFDISYKFTVGGDNRLVPRLTYIDYDRDGRAMANDGAQLELSYIIKADALRYVTNLTFGNFEYDEVNPIYSEKDETDRLGFTFTVFWEDIFGLKDWSGNAGVVWFEDDNKIDFYDTKVGAISIGMLTRF